MATLTRRCSYLEESDVILFDLVIMFDLHGNGLISVHIAQFNVCCVLHEKCSIESSGPETWGEGGGGRERGRGGEEGREMMASTQPSLR